MESLRLIYRMLIRNFLPRACATAVLWLFVAFFPVKGLHAQSARVIDSLLFSLDRASSAQQEASLYNALAFEYVNSDSAKAVAYGQKAIRIGEKHGLFDLIADAMVNMGWVQLRNGHYEQAQAGFEDAFELSSSHGNLKGMGRANHGLGTVYTDRGNWEVALFYLEQSLEQHLEAEDLEGEALSYNQLGIASAYQGNYPKALEFFLRALRVREEQGARFQMAGLLNNIGIIYDDWGDQPQALEYYQQALELNREFNNQRGMASNYANAGKIHQNMGQVEKAEQYFQKSLSINQKLNHVQGIISNLGQLSDVAREKQLWKIALGYLSRALELQLTTAGDVRAGSLYSQIGECHMEEGNHGLALEYLNKAKELGRRASAPSIVERAAKGLSNCYEELGMFREALLEQQLYQHLRDSLFNTSNAREIAKIQDHYAFQKERDSVNHAREKERLQYEMELEQKEDNQMLMGIVLLFSLIAIGAILFQYIQKQQDHRRLLELNASINQQRNEIDEQRQLLQQQKGAMEYQNRKLQDLNEEKNLLVGVVAHDLKSPLNQLSGLLSILRATSQSASPEWEACFNMMSDTIERQRGLITKVLDVSAINQESLNLNMERVDCWAALEESARAFGLSAAEKSIAIKLQAPEGLASYVVADYDYLLQVYQNLLSNAIKFSPPNTDVFIGMKEEEGTLCTFIKDNGPGISAEDQKRLFVKFATLTAKPTGSEVSTGLGLVVVKKYVEAMNGHIYCKSKLGKGSCFIVEFPKAS